MLMLIAFKVLLRVRSAEVLSHSSHLITFIAFSSSSSNVVEKFSV